MRVSMIAFGAALMTMVGVAWAQVPQPPAVAGRDAVPLLQPWDFSSSVRHHLEALGDRLGRPERRRATLQGTLTDGRGSRPLRFVWETPGHARLEIQGSQAIGFDGNRPVISGVLTTEDAAVLESLVEDSAEAFLFAVRDHAAWQVLARRARLDDGRTPNYTGPRRDYYVVDMPVRARQVGSPQRKLFGFDSRTGLIASVRYQTAPGTATETRFSDWQAVDGQLVPGRVERLVNGRSVLSFQLASAAFGPVTADGVLVGQ